jgi:hypothetical protein
MVMNTTMAMRIMTMPTPRDTVINMLINMHITTPLRTKMGTSHLLAGGPYWPVTACIVLVMVF